jgi:hypothetical protein
MIDPRLQEGGANLGAPPAELKPPDDRLRTARAISAVITTPASPKSSGSSPGRKRTPKISSPPMPMPPSTTRMGRTIRASVDGFARMNQKMTIARAASAMRARRMTGMAHCRAGAGAVWGAGTGNDGEPGAADGVCSCCSWRSRWICRQRSTLRLCSRRLAAKT